MINSNKQNKLSVNGKTITKDKHQQNSLMSFKDGWLTTQLMGNIVTHFICRTRGDEGRQLSVPQLRNHMRNYARTQTVVWK